MVMQLNVVKDLPGGRVESKCGMCQHVFTLSRKDLESRLRRFGMVKCPSCGCVLDKP